MSIPHRSEVEPILDPSTAVDSETITSSSNKKKHRLGRLGIVLGLMSGISILGSDEIGLPLEVASATEFVNDYPNQGANNYNVEAFEWWVDENGDGKVYATSDLTDDDELMSPRGYYYRNCTDGVAYWVGKYLGINISGLGGAYKWDSSAEATGYIVKNGTTNNIEPGDIAQSDDNGGWGHVGLIVEVNKDANGKATTLVVAELNKAGDGNYSITKYTTRNGEGKFERPGSNNDWDHFVDVNGEGEGLNGEILGIGLNDILDIVDEEDQWRVSLNGGSEWKDQKEGYLHTARTKVSLELGDFDHDGHMDDILDTTGNSTDGWRVAFDAKNDWSYTRDGKRFKQTSVMAQDTIMGDFDHDHFIDDVLYATGNSTEGWKTSIGGTSDWQMDYLNSAAPASKLLIGDFDQDGWVDDVLHATGLPGSEYGWWVSMGGKKGWDKSFLDSSRPAENLFVIDADHDGFMDDILDTGSQYGWRVSIDGKKGWDDDYRDSTMPSNLLGVGDFDSDGYIDDVFYTTGDPTKGWMYSENGKGDWKHEDLRDSGRTMDTIIIIDAQG